MALGWLYKFSRPKNTNSQKIRKRCPRETDGKLFRYPCNLVMLSYIMVTMWAVAMHLNGAYGSFSDPLTVWITSMNTPIKFVFLKKFRKPPDRASTVHRFWPLLQSYMVVDPVSSLPIIPDFRWGQKCFGNTPSLPSFLKERKISQNILENQNYGQINGDFCGSCAEINTGSEFFPNLSSLTEINSNTVLSQHPKAFVGDNEIFPLLVDSGASCCVSHKVSDFVTEIKTFAHPRVLGGLANGISIEGVGEVEWTVRTDAGAFRTVRAEACYVPQAGRRILSPQSCDQQNAGSTISMAQKVN